ncbi:MAG: hypothetical protein ABFD98_05080 [Syntrophobacteraceae bacterium]|nr:hypothetical protein [Desulfobacteraceae bacterium]
MDRLRPLSAARAIAIAAQFHQGSSIPERYREKLVQAAVGNFSGGGRLLPAVS